MTFIVQMETLSHIRTAHQHSILTVCKMCLLNVKLKFYALAPTILPLLSGRASELVIGRSIRFDSCWEYASVTD